MPLRSVAQQRHARYYADIAIRAHRAYEQAEDDLLKSMLTSPKQTVDMMTLRDQESSTRMTAASDLFSENRIQIDLGWHWVLQHRSSPVTDQLLVDFAVPIGTLGELFEEWHLLAIKLEFAVDVALRCGRQPKAVELLDILGMLASNAHDLHRAVTYHQHALQVAREARDRRGETNALIELGYVYQELGDMQSKLKVYEEWLPLTRENQDKHSECLALGSLGDVHRELGEEQQAITCYHQALILARTLGQHREAGFILDGLGRTYQQDGHIDEAINYYEQSLVTFRDSGDFASEDLTRWHLALAYEAMGHYTRASVLMGESVAFAKAGHLASVTERTAHLARLQQRKRAGLW
ncbi:MAG: tetratricopeptide repeat protein [Chloroflexales bacterium]